MAKHEELKLKRFPIDDHDFSNKIICLIGTRGSGKSYTMRELIKKIIETNMPFGAVFSRSERANKYFNKFVDDLYIFYEANESKLKSIINRGMEITGIIEGTRKYARELFYQRSSDIEIAQLKEAIDKDDKDIEDKLLLTKLSEFWVTLDESQKENLIPLIYIDPRALIIYDDCLYDKGVFKNDSMVELFMNGRHYKLTFIFAMQSPKGITPDLRNNIDYIFLFEGCDVKKTHEAYLSDKLSFKQLSAIMRKVKDYKAIVIHRTSHKELKDSIWWYKADTQPPNIHFGSQLAHDYHDIYYHDTFNGFNTFSTEIENKKDLLEVEY